MSEKENTKNFIDDLKNINESPDKLNCLYNHTENKEEHEMENKRTVQFTNNAERKNSLNFCSTTTNTTHISEKKTLIKFSQSAKVVKAETKYSFSRPSQSRFFTDIIESKSNISCGENVFNKLNDKKDEMGQSSDYESSEKEMENASPEIKSPTRETEKEILMVKNQVNPINPFNNPNNINFGINNPCNMNQNNFTQMNNISHYSQQQAQSPLKQPNFQPLNYHFNNHQSSQLNYYNLKNSNFNNGYTTNPMNQMSNNYYNLNPMQNYPPTPSNYIFPRSNNIQNFHHQNLHLINPNNLQNQANPMVQINEFNHPTINSNSQNQMIHHMNYGNNFNIHPLPIQFMNNCNINETNYNVIMINDNEVNLDKEKVASTIEKLKKNYNLKSKKKTSLSSLSEIKKNYEYSFSNILESSQSIHDSDSDIKNNDFNLLKINQEIIEKIFKKDEEDFEDYISSKTGSQAIQSIFEHLSKSENSHKVLKETIKNFLNKVMEMNLKNIILSKYGSFFFECLIKYLTLDQTSEIIKNQNIASNFKILCCGKYSNIVIQQLIKKIEGTKLEKPFKALIEKNIDDLARDQCANFVLNQFINKFTLSSKTIVFEFIEKKLVSYATESQYGHYLTKNFIKFIADELINEDCPKKLEKLKTIQENFIKRVLEHFMFLANNKFGHFVLIDIIEMWGIIVCQDVLVLIKKNIDKLARIIYGYAIIKRVFIMYYNNEVSSKIFYFLLGLYFRLFLLYFKFFPKS